MALPLLGIHAGRAEAPPSCTELLNGMQAKVEANYAGYVLEVRDTRRRSEYDRLVVYLGSLAAANTSAGCFPVLARYAAWFNDPHLFVFQSQRLDSAETRRRIATLAHLQVNEADVRARLEQLGAAADPIEGIWYDGARRVAVVPDPAQPKSQFIAVVTTSDTATLPVGAIHAIFTRRPNGEYDAELRWPSLAVTRPPVSLHRGATLLRLSPGMWGKAFPGPAAERRLLDTVNVHRPTLTWRERTAIISVPSHDGSNRALLNSLLNANRERFDSADALIIDLRGNEGGGSQTTAALNAYVLGSEPISPLADFGDPVMLSSPDQINYVRRAFGSDTTAFVRRLVSAMEAAPGTLVPMFDPLLPRNENRYPAPIFGPRRVAILIDGGTVSAAEVIVQLGLHSERTVVIGEPTAGALDYQSVNVVRIIPEETRWLLGYPTVTAHARLPEGGMRGKGIQPEVSLRWSESTDPVAAALKALGREQ